jgi:outer membrane receptor protein involved in Fe transport
MPGRHLRRYLFRFAMILMLTMAPGTALAEEPTASLDTVIVTADRFPVKEKESPHFVTVVTAEELKESGGNNVVDALKRRGGFGYKAFAPLGISQGGMNSKLMIRGIEGGELVLINGVPIQGATGHGYDLNAIPIDQVERVEILKGAASTLYGADAMTGVINIITKKPSAETRTNLSVEFGNEAYHNHTLSYSSPKLDMGVNYQHLGSQTEISRNFTGNYRYDSDAMDKFNLNLNIQPVEHVFIDYLGSYSETGFKKVFENGGPYEGTDQKHFKHFADLRYETPNFKAKAFGTYDEMQRNEYTSDDPEDKNKNYNYGLEGDYRFDLSGLQWVAGTDFVHRASDFNNSYGDHDRNDYSIFFQLKKELFSRLLLTFGAREQFIDGESGTKDYDRFLPSFGATYKATENLNLFVNAGKAFRAPTFNQLYYESAFLLGNPDLDPEEGWTYELGSKWDASGLVRLRLSGFYYTFQDKIELDRSGGYPLTYYNAGEYESKGIEWELDLYPFSHHGGWMAETSLYTAGYWADPIAEDTAGESYQAGPKLQTSLGMAYQSESLAIDLNCQMLAAREKNLNDYTVLNLYAKYKLGKGFLTFAVDNVFNEEVQISGDLSEDASSRYVYYEVGRLFKAGYEISF